MTADWSDNPDFKKFAKQVLRDTVPNIVDSAYFLTIAPDGGSVADVRQAVEIGFAILLDKPLIVFKPNGRMVAERLLRIADHVIEGDMDTEEGRQAIMEQLQRVMKQ